MLLHGKLFQHTDSCCSLNQAAASNTVKGEMLLVLLYITANGNNVERLQSLLRVKDTEGEK